ncbi:hypothetical protein AAVH_09403 [Aphelenchoides avenae]|nr:hypothetical protein AAVH_09403 [Aphelenchus avenae]
MRMNDVCQIFRDSKVPTSLLANLPQQLEKSFTSIGLKVADDIRVLDPPASAFDRNREQYRADKIVDNCCAQAPGKICLYLLTDDAYSGTLNFVFGVAHRGRGCMVTLYRLQNDPDFVLKECVHELGHVFGLGHCSLPCVMTFSNSVCEAHQKNITFCPSCKASLAKYCE